MAELKVNADATGTLNIPGPKTQPNVLNIAPGVTVDASDMVFNTKGKSVTEAGATDSAKNNFINSTIRFQAPDNDVSKYSVKINEDASARGQTKLGDGSGLPPEISPRSHITLYKTGPDGKKEAVSTVRLEDIDAAGIKGGNKDFASTIQIQTPDGQVHKIAKPEFGDYYTERDFRGQDTTPEVVKNADAKIKAAAKSDKDKANTITPEIIAKAQEAVAPKSPGEVNPVLPTAVMNQPAPQPAASPSR